MTLIALTLLLAADPLTLRQALDRTAAESPDVLAARLRLVEAEAQAERTRAAYRPQVNLVLGSAYQTGNLQGIGLLLPGFDGRIGPYRTFNLRPVLSQTVLDLKLLAQMRASRELQTSARHDAEAVRETAQLAVSELYLQALQAQSRRRAAEARVATALAALEQARHRKDAGGASQLDVVRAEQQWHTEQAMVAEIHGEHQATLARLARAMGTETAPAELADPALPLNDADAETLKRRGWEQRWELRALEARLSASNWDVKSAQRERFPTLAATGDYGVLGAGPDRALSTYQVGASLNVPLWTSGRMEADTRAARARTGIVKEQLRQARLAVAEEVQRGLAEYQAAEAARQQASEARAAAAEALELARIRFNGGLATNLDVVTAQGLLAQAEDAAIRYAYGRQLAQVRLAHAAGSVGSLVR